MSLKLKTLAYLSRRSFSLRPLLASAGDAGSGVAHGGGAGGSIREAGGKFGEFEAAAENVYFKRIEAEQLAELRKKHDDQIRYHESEIQKHMDAIKKLRGNMDDIEEKNNKANKN